MIFPRGKVTSLKSYSKQSFIIMSVMLGVVLVLLAVLIIVIGAGLDQLPTLVVSLILLVLMLGAITYIVLMSLHLYNLFYKQGIEISARNVQALSNFDKNFDYYKNDQYEEIKILNSSFKDIAKNVEGRTIISQGLIHQDVPLEFEEDERFVKEQSLLKNVKNLILVSESYRNALIDVSYNLGKELIDEKIASRIYKQIVEALEYDNILVSFKENKQGFLIYVPAFDSINQLEEELEYLIKDISLVRRGGTTKRAIVAHVSMVVYPYSSIDNLVRDLNRVKKEKKVLNIYIPEREFEYNNKLLFSSMNINNTTKLIEDVASLDPDPKKYNENLSRIRKCISNISNYYGFHSSGYIEYNRENEIYVNDFIYCTAGVPVFKENVEIDKKFINVINLVKDSDSSYYFSSRKHIHNKIAEYVDRYRLCSGLFFVLTRDQRPVGVLYFLNRNKDLKFDAYMKESLITSCHVLGGMIKEIDARRNVAVADKRLSEILKISGMNLYSVNKETYEFVRYSPTLNRLFPRFDDSEPCYKALYGQTKPCKNCPLKQRKHMLSEIGGKKYEVYPIFTNKDDPTAHLLIQPTKGNELNERFDDETLLSSFASFSSDLANQLSVQIEGKILLLKIKNSREIVSAIKGGGYIQLIKEFVDRVLIKYSDFGEAYQFNNSTLALLLHGKSDEEIIAICQDICEIVKNVKVEDSGLSLIYLVKNYHHEETVEFIQKALLDGLDKYKNEIEEEIIFIDTDYKRSASLEGYLLEQLLISFREKTYEMEFTPLLSNNTRLIYGVEIKPNLLDTRINKKLDINLAIDIATKRGFGDVYSDGMLDYIDDLISRYTYTYFMSVGISEFALKVDHNFIVQPRFLEHLKEIYTKHQLPYGFLTFEVSEDDVSDNKDEFEDIVKKVDHLGAKFLVYDYEGTKLQVSQLADMRFKEIKFSKKILSSINDQESYTQTTFMWLEAVKHQMKVNFTGVESRKTSEAIVFEGYDCGVQGDYYFKSMDENNAFETIRERNMKDKDNLDN